MTIICHGNGNIDEGGCCYVNGAVCPHRLTQETLQAFVAKYKLNAQRTARVQEQIQGLTWACGIAAAVIANDPSLINNRAQFETAWNTHPEYVAVVRPHWDFVEDSNGWARGTYNCSTWGPAGAQCCFGETEAVNAQKAANLHPTAVTVRTAGGKK